VGAGARRLASAILRAMALDCWYRRHRAALSCSEKLSCGAVSRTGAICRMPFIVVATSCRKIGSWLLTKGSMPWGSANRGSWAERSIR
jgi:hypothetical protein